MVYQGESVTTVTDSPVPTVFHCFLVKFLTKKIKLCCLFSQTVLNQCLYVCQLWEHTLERTLRHKRSGLCLDSKDVKSGQHVTIDNCDSNKYSWQFSLNMND